MPIDTSIYQSLIKPKSVGDFQAEYDQQQLSQHALQQNALGLQQSWQKLDEYGRTVREGETVRNALAGLGAGATDEQRVNALYGTGVPAGYTQADALRKQMVERQKAKAEAAKTNAGLLKQYSGILVQSPTMQTFESLAAHYTQQTGENIDNIRAIVQQSNGDPEVIRKIGAALSMEADKLLPKTVQQDNGGSNQTLAIDPLTGKPTVTSTTAKTMTPGESARLAQSASQFAATQAAAAEQRAFDRSKPPAGAVPTAQKVSDATEAIALINQAEPLLPGSTGSYGGLAIDKVAQFFGAATPGAINAQQLKAIEGALVSKMPKMSGPQSDKDVALYRQMAAVIGDETIPYKQKAAALQTVREIQERYAGLAPGSSNTGRKVSGTVAPSAPEAASGVVEWGSLK